MPRILEMKEIDGKLAVFLDMPTDSEGSVTIWTEAEARAAFKAERETCAKIAESMGGDFIECDAHGDGYIEARKHIAAAIRNLST